MLPPQASYSSLSIPAQFLSQGNPTSLIGLQRLLPRIVQVNLYIYIYMYIYSYPYLLQTKPKGNGTVKCYKNLMGICGLIVISSNGIHGLPAQNQ